MRSISAPTSLVTSPTMVTRTRGGWLTASSRVMLTSGKSPTSPTRALQLSSLPCSALVTASSSTEVDRLPRADSCGGPAASVREMPCAEVRVQLISGAGAAPITWHSTSYEESACKMVVKIKIYEIISFHLTRL